MARRGDRASMREGPLAALFRKTEGEEPEAEAGAEAPAEQPQPEQPRAEAPHPSLSEPSPAPPPEEEPRIPSPQERLRHAFSSDIPENVMAPPSEQRRQPEPEPAAPPILESDPYARSAQPTFGQALPVGQPVLRVVGVGGAGVNAVNRMVEAEVEGVEFVAVNTDLQSLQQSHADTTLHIGQ
jgi:cell division protein FtsZ